jgi:hypothetical protein
MLRRNKSEKGCEVPAIFEHFRIAHGNEYRSRADLGGLVRPHNGRQFATLSIPSQLHF